MGSLRHWASAACLLAPMVAAAIDTPPQARTCLACHGLVHKQVGPGFAQIAARYRDDPGAPSALAASIRNGSVGHWGRVIMPRQTQLSEADARALAAWVLAQPPQP